MAYSPSLGDIQSDNAGYAPSLDDLPSSGAMVSNQTSPNVLQDVANNPVGRGFLDLAAGVGNFAQGVGNLPYEALHAVDQIGTPTNLASYVSPPTNVNYSQYFGINNPDVYDKMIQGAAQYAPYGAGAEMLPAASASAGLLSKIAGQGLAGASYGLTQSSNPTQGAILGGMTGAGTAGAGSLVGGGLNMAGNFLSQYAAPSLAKGIGNLVDYGSQVNNQTAYQMAKDNLQNNWEPKETTAWNNLKSLGQQVDYEPTVNYDDSGYTQGLNNQLNNLKNQSQSQSGFARANDDSESMLQGYINDQHGTFSDAFSHNQALNKDYQNEITPGKSLPFSTVNYAKSQLANNIQQNITNNGLQSTLGTSWNDANAITQQKNQIFNSVTNPNGGTQISSFSKFVNNNNPASDGSTFVNQYIPKSGAEGTQKMQQFSQMVGDPDYANQVLKSNIFNGKTDPQGFMKIYNNLSPNQQNFLFNPDQNSNIQALNTMMSKNPSLFGGSLFKEIWAHSIPSLLAGAAGGAASSAVTHGIGISDLGYGLGAAALAKGTGLMASKLMGLPSMQNMVVNSLTKPPGVTGQLVKALAARSTQGLANPSVINNKSSIMGSLPAT